MNSTRSSFSARLNGDGKEEEEEEEEEASVSVDGAGRGRKDWMFSMRNGRNRAPRRAYISVQP
jgi:hypothetical protein